jgi:hypothetical protein
LILGGGSLLQDRFCTVLEWIQTPTDLLSIVVLPEARLCFVSQVCTYKDLTSVTEEEALSMVFETSEALSTSQTEFWQTNIQKNYAESVLQNSNDSLRFDFSDDDNDV